jgi:hypothetical protein
VLGFRFWLSVIASGHDPTGIAKDGSVDPKR